MSEESTMSAVPLSRSSALESQGIWETPQHHIWRASAPICPQSKSPGSPRACLSSSCSISPSQYPRTLHVAMDNTFYGAMRGGIPMWALWVLVPWCPDPAAGLPCPKHQSCGRRKPQRNTTPKKHPQCWGHVTTLWDTSHSGQKTSHS
jgi:hypothetical protein